MNASRRRSCALAVSLLGACSDDEPPLDCHGFDDWACAQEMCEACLDLGGQMKILESAEGEPICVGDDDRRLDLAHGDFCEPAHCADAPAVEVSASATDPLASALLETVAKEHVAELTWFPDGAPGLTDENPTPGATTTLTIRIDVASPVRFIGSEVVVPEAERSPDHAGHSLTCADRYEVDASFSLTTADGRLLEHRMGVLEKASALDGMALDPSAPATAELQLDMLPAGVDGIPASTQQIGDIAVFLAVSETETTGGIHFVLLPEDDATGEPATVFLAEWSNPSG